MARGQEEFRLSCLVADYLRHALPADVAWSHFPAGEARTAITGARLKRMGLAKGWPDYLILWDGDCIGIELKADKGKASAEQIIVAEGFRRAGFTWALCRSLEEVERVLDVCGVPLVAKVAA